MSRPITTTDLLVLLGVCALLLGLPAYGLYQMFSASKSSDSAAPAAPSAQIVDVNIAAKNPLAPDEPSQYSLDRPQTFAFKGYEIHELAGFSAHAVLLSKHAYSGEGEHKGALSPMDFAIAWGAMSNPSVLKNFLYYQKDRFFYWTTLVSYAPEANRIRDNEHLANVHIIPANEAIAAALNKVKPRDLVTLEGSLVEVFYHKQMIWKSSLTFQQMGPGACKLLFLRRLEWFAHPPGSEIIPLPQVPNESDATPAPVVNPALKNNPH